MKKLDGQDIFEIPAAPEALQAILDAGRRIHVTTDAIDTIVSDRLGLHRSDLRCLHLLRYGCVTPRDIALQTGLTSGSVTALLDRLEIAGFIERRRSLSDRRSVEIALPPEQQAKMSAVYDELVGAFTAHFVGRSQLEIDRVAAALDDFASALEDGAARLSPRCPTAADGKI